MKIIVDTEDHDQRKVALAEINDQLTGRSPKGRPVPYAGTKLIEVSRHDLPVVQHALVKRLQQVQSELNLLRLSRERDLTQIERWQLPSNLQQFTQEQLQEQVDPWITLEMTIQGLIEDFNG